MVLFTYLRTENLRDRGSSPLHILIFFFVELVFVIAVCNFARSWAFIQNLSTVALMNLFYMNDLSLSGNNQKRIELLLKSIRLIFLGWYISFILGRWSCWTLGWFNNRKGTSVDWAARAKQTTCLTNDRAANRAPEVEVSPFRALFRRQVTFLFSC